MRDRYDEINKTGFQLIVIFPTIKSLLEQFVEAFGPFPFEVYGDPDRNLYKNMGHVTMSKLKLLAKAGSILLKQGSKTFMPKDENQLKVVKKSMKNSDLFIQGGTWIYTQTGEVIWNHIDSEPEDHATIDQILEHISSNSS